MTTATEAITLPSDQDISGRTLGAEELTLVAEALGTGTLTSTRGRFVRELERRFADLLGVPHAVACSSGTAALHAAVAALDPNPGDEVVTTPVTDMGALAPILYQGAIPVFADVDPETCNVTARSIEACLSERTRAVVVTHLFGNPCAMNEIRDLARSRSLPVIEDCAQAYLARYRGHYVGTLGAFGVFSLQQGKHITAGEGGLVCATDDALARRMRRFVNKAWDYHDPNPDHDFLALNYRMSELQGAVAVAQLRKLPEVVRRRIELARGLTERLRDVPGVATPAARPGCVASYWRYCLRIDPEVIPGGAAALGQALRERGIACAPRYIQKPAFQCGVFTHQRTFGTSRYPFLLARPEALDYRPERFPGTFAALDRILVLPWTERYTEEHLDYLADAIRSGAGM